MKIPLRIKVLSVVFLVLAVAAYFALQKKLTVDTIQKNDTEVAIADTSSIEKITVEKDGETRVLKKEGGVWKINDRYEVRHNVMNLLLMGLHQLEIKRPVAEELKKNTMDLLRQKGAKVTVDFGDRTKTLLFASNENDVNTTYLLPGKGSTPYVAYVPGVPGDINNIFKLQEHEWRSRELFRSNSGSVQHLKVTYPSDPSQSFEIYFEGGEYFVRGLSKMDTARVDSYLNYYSFAPVSGYVKAEADSLQALFQKAKLHATIELTDINSSRSASIKVYRSEDPKNYLGTIGKNGELVTVNKELFDYLLVKKDYFKGK